METPKNPAFEIDMNGEKFLATPENTTLFAFIGELAVYDHVFIQTGEIETTPTGAYLFKNQVVWDDMIDFMVTNDYTQHLNLREVADCDRDAFNRTFYEDTRHMQSFPQEWASNGTE